MTDIERKISLNKDIVVISADDLPVLADRTDAVNATQIREIPRLLGTRRELKLVPVSRWNFESDCKDACAICMQKHTRGESVRADCGHKFGMQCWAAWTARNNSCPTCRKARPGIRAFCMKPDGQPALTRKEAHRKWADVALQAIARHKADGI